MNLFTLALIMVLFAIPAKKYGFRKTLTTFILFVSLIGAGVIAWAFASGNIP